MHLFAVVDASLPDPLGNPGLGLRKALYEVGREEALHPGALHQQVTLRSWARIPRIPARIGRGAADHDASAKRQVSQDRVRNGSRRIVEINMNAVRASAP